MTKQQLILLGQTYNTLTTISTKGNDTISMAECLKALKSLYESLKYEVKDEEGEE